jgi:hypothetical protein
MVSRCTSHCLRHTMVVLLPDYDPWPATPFPLPQVVVLRSTFNLEILQLCLLRKQATMTSSHLPPIRRLCLWAFATTPTSSSRWFPFCFQPANISAPCIRKWAVTYFSRMLPPQGGYATSGVNNDCALEMIYEWRLECLRSTTTVKD